MTSGDLRQKFLDFYKARGHTIVPSSSLLPDDPSVLLTTAGMQQFKPYFVGKADPHKDFGSLNTVSIQKSFRTSDIDEVGDESHLTFFEMMGNFSFGGYFKEGAITYAHEFLQELGLAIQYVTIFEGDGKVSKDEESRRIWESLGVSDIREAGREDNFWGPTGNEGPCGPTTEIYINDTEVWNIVFNEYYRKPDRTLEKLETPGVDTGMGLERLAMVKKETKTIFETDLFMPLLGFLSNELGIETKRIIMDHLRGSVFLIVDGVQPSNKDRGYILRRVLRRAISHIASKERIISTPLRHEMPKELNERVASVIKLITDAVIKEYGDWYKELLGKNELVDTIVHHEIGKSLDLLKSSSELRRVIEFYKSSEDRTVPGPVAFHLFSTFGITIDYVRDEAKRNNLTINEKGFEAERKKHQEISRAGQERKFGGHGLILDTGELKAANEEELKIVTRLHTATHLLQAALRKVLGDTIHQDGSDITAERLRFDFIFDRKLTPEELSHVEQVVNEAIEKNLDMSFVEMPYEEAVSTGALYFKKQKYPGRVKVYSAVDSGTGEVFSRELCGGPHVSHAKELGHFKITKEESVGAGARRIRAIVEKGHDISPVGA